MAQKKRYRVIITQECKYHGRPKELWLWAKSKAQAQLFARHRYNKERKKVPEAFVEMIVKEVPPKN